MGTVHSQHHRTLAHFERFLISEITTFAWAFTSFILFTSHSPKQQSNSLSLLTYMLNCTQTYVYTNSFH